MNMKTCPQCAEKDIQDDAIVCKHCGFRAPEEEQQLESPAARKAKHIICAILLAVAVVAAIWLIANQKPEDVEAFRQYEAQKKMQEKIDNAPYVRIIK